jgi:hypothetical protein
VASPTDGTKWTRTGQQGVAGFKRKMLDYEGCGNENLRSIDGSVCASTVE